MKLKQYKLGILFLVITVILASTGAALDFTVTCPTSVQSNVPFDCTLAAPQSLKGISFTLSTGIAQLNSVTFAGGLTDISVPPTYGFFTISSPHPANSVFATVNLQTTEAFTFQVNGIRATLGDDTVLGATDMIFLPASISIAPPPAVDLCDTMICTPISEVCPDGVSVSCTPTCSAGVCGSCTPDCTTHQLAPAISPLDTLITSIRAALAPATPPTPPLTKLQKISVIAAALRDYFTAVGE
ncbi:hypothetical protein HYU22_04535 [Candidatus Woesearchaeota archaeon]|nr:hypothetical protein [Candidatus Woesearchaeota archaeon]